MAMQRCNVIFRGAVIYSIPPKVISVSCIIRKFRRPEIEIILVLRQGYFRQTWFGRKKIVPSLLEFVIVTQQKVDNLLNFTSGP